jgi:hypothetical protein
MKKIQKARTEDSTKKRGNFRVPLGLSKVLLHVNEFGSPRGGKVPKIAE